ncbi:MAG: hypothetical protein KDB53_13945 [Planctomycetes bacterium]|nr:hypothetical protein [Planctomycetota bacterium]
MDHDEKDFGEELIEESEEKDGHSMNDAIGLGGGAGGSFGGRRGGRKREFRGSTITPGKLQANSPVQGLGQLFETGSRDLGASVFAASASREQQNKLKAIDKQLGLLSGTADPSAAEPVVRKQILALAWFNPKVKTDETGRTKVRFTLPHNITTWKIQTVGITRATHVGEAEASVIAWTPLAASLVGPRFLSDGDRGRMSALADNFSSDTQDVTMSIEVSGAIDHDMGPTEALTLKAGERGRRDLEVTAKGRGQAELRLRARSAMAADALDQLLPLAAFGARRFSGGSGSLTEEALFDFDREGAFLPGTGRATLVVSGGVPGDLVEAALSPVMRRAGIVADAGRTLALLRVLSLADSRGLEVPFSRDLMRAMVRSGVDRIVAARGDDGSFGWCGPGSSDPFVSALAIEALAEATSQGFLDAVAFDLSASFAALARMIGRHGNEADAAMLFAASLAGTTEVSHLNRLIRASNAMSATGLAWLLLAAENGGHGVQAADLARRLEGRLVTAKGLSHARGNPRVCWQADAIESTAWALRALLAHERTGPVIDGMADWLRSQRHGPSFGSPKANAVACQALGALLTRQDFRNIGGRIVVELGGDTIGEINLSGADALASAALEIPFEKLREGKNRLRLLAPGLPTTFFSLQVEWLAPAESIAARPGIIAVDRTLTAWRSDEVRAREVEPGHEILRPESRPPVAPPSSLDELTTGQRYTVVLDLRCDEAQDFVVLEEPLLAGLEVIESDMVGPFADVERLDDRLVFRLAKLPVGRTRLEYGVFAAWPGRYRSMPATAALAFDPERGGASSDHRVRIFEAVDGVSRLVAPRPTPDESYAAGVRDFEAGRLEKAASDLRGLLDLDLREEVRVAILERLLVCDLRAGRARAAVTDFEGLSGSVNLTTDDRHRLGRAYAEIGDAERARAHFGTVLGDRLTDELRWRDRLRQAGKLARAAEVGWNLAVRQPDSRRSRALMYESAEAWFDIPDEERSKHEEFPRALRMRFERGLDQLETALALAGETLESGDVAFREISYLARLGSRDLCEKRAREFIALYPQSEHADDAALIILKICFAREDWDAAFIVGTDLATKDWISQQRGNRVSGPSEHRGQAIYHLGRIAQVRGDVKTAMEHYERVKDQFEDANQSWLFYREVRLELPELTRIPVGSSASLQMELKNLDRIDWSLYRVDLPLVFTVRKSLSDLHRVDLTGIPPDRVGNVEGIESEFRDRRLSVSIGDLEPGSWLVVVDSGSTRRTGIVLVSDLSIRLARHGSDLRVQVTRGPNESPVSNAEIKAGNGGAILGGGQTDERGILVLRNLPTGVTILASSGDRHAIVSE